MKTLIETLNNPTDDGLYSLKALCAAAGNYEKNRPYDFLRQPSIKRYLHKSPVLNELTIRKTQGRNGDTFVNKHLVYRFAMWVSDDFHDLVIDTFDSLLNAITTQEVIDLKFQLDNALQQDIFAVAQQPRDKNCLQVLMNCTPFQVNQFYDELEYQGQVKSRLVPQPPKRIFEATDKSTCIVGKKGDTLLFSESVRDLFPEQQNWTD